jgi:hypothetical protein
LETFAQARTAVPLIFWSLGEWDITSGGILR